MASDRAAPVCELCGKPMKLVCTLPKLSELPIVETFSCDPCNNVISVKSDD